MSSAACAAILALLLLFPNDNVDERRSQRINLLRRFDAQRSAASRAFDLLYVATVIRIGKIDFSQ